MNEGTLAASLAGLAQALTPAALGSLTIGVLTGALVGILPGLGGPSSVALLLPFVFDSSPHQAFALLIGLISVTATTGDLTSILLGIPGESTAAATVLDGHPMARRGQAGLAMGVSLGSSLAGALFGALVMGLGVSAARPLSHVIGSPELFAFAVLGVCCALPLASRSPLRGLASGTLGLTLATVGLDPLSGTPRFTMGQLPLWDGIGLIPTALGLFAVPEIVQMAGRGLVSNAVPDPGHRQFVAGLREVGHRWRVVLRSSAIGTGIGLLPGVGASVSQWMAYAHAARYSDRPDQFGHGAIDGVIAPSAANNATLGGSLVPTLALGVPGGLASALFLTALVVKGFVPGPQMLMPEQNGGHLEFVFSLGWMIALANIMVVAITWAVSPWLVKITRVRAAVLVPILVLLVCVGAFSERNLMTDVVTMVVMSIVGLSFARFDWPRAPLLIGLVLGPLAEDRLFVSIEAYGALWWARPIVIVAGAVILGLTAYPLFRRQRRPDVAGERVLQPRLSPAERIMLLILLAMSLSAFAATMDFPRRAALFPRMSLLAGIVTMGIMIGRAFRGGASAAAATGAGLDRAALGATVSVAAFAASIWALGFTWGALLAVVTMMIAQRERPGAIIVVAASAVVFVEVVMGRILHVPLPAGTVFESVRSMVAG